jgi:hypothetical protein
MNEEVFRNLGCAASWCTLGDEAKEQQTKTQLEKSLSPIEKTLSI